MDDADVNLARRYFPAPNSVFLLVKPFVTRPSVGGFFFWEDGEINRESTYLEFPFQRRELGGGESRLAPPPRKPQAETSPLPAVEREPAHPRPAAEPQPAAPISNPTIWAPDEPAKSPRRLEWRWLLVPGFLVIAGVSGFFTYRNLDQAKPSARPSAPPQALPLKLSVSDRKGQLDVTWDRNARAVTRAKRGILTITDGDKRRDLELNGLQLRNGRVVYSRISGDVSLRLEVFPEGQPGVVESIRVISTVAPPPAESKPVAVDQPARKPKSPPARQLPQVPARPVAETTTPPVTEPPAAPEIEVMRPERRR
jgi:hypothetical protein